MSKIFGFLLGIAVALALPAGFGGLAAEGGIELSAREMALAYGVGALVFWAVVSYFAGAAALGAALTFGAMIYAVHWIPNRMRNFLDDIPGVTTGMIEGIRQYTLNGLVPVLAVISLVYAIQLMVRAARRRRQLRAEAALRQREQELAQQQQEADSGQYQSAAPYQAPTPYPASSSYAQGGDYPTSVDNRYDESYGANADQTRHNQSSGYERTAQYPVTSAGASADNDETTQIPTESTGAHSTRFGSDAATAEFPTSQPTEGESSRSRGQQPTEPRSAARPAPEQGTGSSQLGGASSQGGSSSQGGGSSQGGASSQGGRGSSPAAGSRSAQSSAGSPQQSQGGATQQPTNDGPREPGRDQGQVRNQGPNRSESQDPEPGRNTGPGRDLGPRASAENPGQRPTAGFHQPGHYSEQSQQAGQQYRERMDNPDHHFTVEPENHPQAFLTNQFRIA